jgi:hypothetical protein
MKVRVSSQASTVEDCKETAETIGVSAALTICEPYQYLRPVALISRALSNWN